MRAVLSLVLAILLAGGGAGAFALAANTDQWESDRLVSEAVAAATVELTDARADALAERTRLAALTSDATELLTSARALLALNPGWADAALLVALTTAADALGAELDAGLPPGVPVIDATTIDEMAEWTGRLTAMQTEAGEISDRRDGVVQTAQTAVDDLVRAAVKGGPGIAAMTLPDEALRDAARTALALVADNVRAGTDPTESLTAYTTAWAAVRDAQAAAEAAAAAAAAAAAEAAQASDADSSPFGNARTSIIDKLKEAGGGVTPTIIATENYVPSCDGYVKGSWFDSHILFGGESITLSYAFPYDYSLRAEDGIWLLTSITCV